MQTFTRLALIAIIGLTLPSLPKASWAQGLPTGSVLGTVKDAVGAVVPAAAVTLTNVDTGVARSATSSAGGEYLFPNVPPGNYRVEVSAQGFKKYVQPLTIQVAMSTTVDATLEVGALQSSVTVNAQPPLLDTYSASLGTVVSSRMISDMPVSGNNPLRLLQLVPGMVQASGPSRISLGNTGLVAGAGQVGFNTVGGSDRQNSYFTLDGASNARGSQPGYESTTAQTQEFNVMTNTYDAQYGRVAGPIINAVTKGGTNSLHGQAYEYVQNDVLNSFSFFQNLAGLRKKTPDRYNQFGGAVGGPIARNKTFFFFNYERINASQPILGTFAVPTVLERNGDFSQTKVAGKPVQIFNPFSTRPDPSKPGQFIRDPFSNNMIDSKLINPVATGVLSKFWPMPNAGTNLFVASATPSDKFNLYSIRVDHNISERNRLFSRFSWTRLNDQVVIGIDEFAPEVDIYLNGVVGFTSNLTPTTVLEVFGGWMNSRLTNPAAFQTDLAALGFDPSFVRMLNLKNAVPGFHISGAGDLFTSNGRWDNEGPWSFNANLRQMRGRHSLKYGFQNETYVPNFGNLGGNGDYNFNGTFTQGPNPFTTGSNIGYGLADFLLGTFSKGTLNSPDNAANTERYYAGYFQDDYRVTPKLSLNLGLRWDAWTGSTERYNRLNAGWAYNTSNPVQAAATANYALNPIPELSVAQFSSAITGGLLFVTPSNRNSMPAHWNNFSPRFGVAYRLGQRTVLRGGYGLFKSFSAWGNGGRTGFSTSSDAVATIDGVTPFNVISNPYPTGFAQPTGSSLRMLTQVGGSVSPQNQFSLPQPMVRWNLGFQRQLSANTMVEVVYVGTTWQKATIANAIPGNGIPTSLTGNFISNQLFTTLGPTGRLNQTVPNPFFGVVPKNTSRGSTSKISVQNLLSSYPEFSSVSFNRVTGGEGYYHSLQMTLTKRFSHGFSTLGTFTWSKDLMRRFFLNTGDSGPSKMLAPYDAPKRLTFAGLWELPFGQGQPWGPKSGALGKLIGGWQTNAIWTWQSGFLSWITNPVQATGISPALPSSQRTWQHWINTASYVVKPTFALRTASYTDPGIRSGPINDWDLSLLKNTSVSERLKLQFRWEMYNAFNKVEFGGPDMNPNSITFGCACGLSQGARTMQFGLKLLF